MRYSLDGRRILITGASRGIGAEMARILGDRAGKLILVARSEPDLEALAQSLSAPTRTIVADLASHSGLDALWDELREEEIDVLVNNAGAGVSGPLVSCSEEQLLAQVELNVISLLRLTRRCIPAMLERGHGAILNVGSLAGFQGGPYFATYCATKAFVNNFTDGLASELRGTGVQATAFCPGTTRTDFFRAAGMPEEEMIKVSQDARSVAEVGLRAVERGRPLAIPGFTNKVLLEAQRLAPRALVRWVTRRLFAPLNR